MRIQALCGDHNSTPQRVFCFIDDGCAMNLDVKTLFLITIYVEAILGLLLLFAWIQNVDIRAVAWWGCAHLVRATSVVLFGVSGFVVGDVSADLACSLLFLAYAITWAGARVFDGRRALPLWIAAGPALWLLLSHIPAVSGTADQRIVLSSGIIVAYTWLAASEFWRGRSEPLVSRWPAIFMLVAQGTLVLLRTPLATLLPWSPVSEVVDNIWLTVLSFEALLFTIAVAFILLAMAKERTEYRHRTAAMVDPLTGIANRRAFLIDSGELVRKVVAGARPVAVLVIDLDHFKSINDRFGHAIGDRVLQIFATTAKGAMRQADRQTDLLGRLGGEEFAAVLCNLSPEKATAVAEHIRRAFAEATHDVDGCAVAATLSIGIVLHQGSPVDVLDLLMQADHELYCAKEHGRNRVEVATYDGARDRQRIAAPMALGSIGMNPVM
jgi:diguanylate cyclase (GGDEF)-like protein